MILENLRIAALIKSSYLEIFFNDIINIWLRVPIFVIVYLYQQWNFDHDIATTLDYKFATKAGSEQIKS